MRRGMIFMEKRKKIISMLLVLVLMFSAMDFTSITAETPTVQQAVNNELDYDNQYDKNLVLPDVIKDSDADAAEKYISRVHSYEKDLNTFVFRNNDGTYTKKLYSYPVKYVDKAGETRDITTDIEKLSDGSFRTAENNIVTTFSKTLSEGITLSHDDVVIKMIPSAKFTTESSASSLSSDKKTVSYPYGNKTKLEYSLTYTGFKEDIVVEEYTGQTEYTFALYTNGLFVTEIDGSFYLVDNDKNIKAIIGDIIIFTADEKNNTMGRLTSQAVNPGQIYTMTIHVDADYLKDKKTLYPIRIDPTIEISYSKNGAGAIEDATINSSAGSAGTSGSLYIGKRETYGISRALMKFPALNLNDIYSSSNIVSATVTVRDLLCESTAMNISAHIFTGNTWSESSISWSGVNANSFVSTALDTVTMSWNNGVAQPEDHFYEFDITTAVKGWKTGTYSKDKGIIFKMASSVENGSSYINRTIASYNRAEQKPVLEVVYNPKITLNYSSITLSNSQTREIVATTYPSDIDVTWDSSNTGVATVSNGIVTAISAGTTIITATITDSDGVSSSATCIVYVSGIYDVAPRIVSGQIYYIKNKNSGQYLDVNNAEDTDGRDVHQWIMNGTDAQRWQVVHVGNGIYKFISQLGSKTRVLNVSGGGSENTTNINIWTDSESSSKRFSIVLNDDGYSYRILSLCSGYTKAVTVINASCSSGDTIFQYQYNGTWNDEWIFEPVFDYSVDLAVNYAKNNYNKKVQTYPYVHYLGGDCANFVSQCMLAGGVHYQDTWWVYKLNNDYLEPGTVNELDHSWDLSDPSPWISAKQFNDFWAERVEVETYKGIDIINNPSLVYSRPFFKGDVIQILEANLWGSPGDAIHTMFITGYSDYNGNRSYSLTYHSGSTLDKNLLEIAEAYENSYFRFFSII